MRKNPDAEKNNPCLKEQEKSFKCFSDNDYNKEACKKEIDNYNLCKSFWVTLNITVPVILFTYIPAESGENGQETQGDKASFTTCRRKRSDKKRIFSKVFARTEIIFFVKCDCNTYV